MILKYTVGPLFLACKWGIRVGDACGACTRGLHLGPALGAYTWGRHLGPALGAGTWGLHLGLALRHSGLRSWGYTWGLAVSRPTLCRVALSRTTNSWESGFDNILLISPLTTLAFRSSPIFTSYFYINSDSMQPLSLSRYFS